MRRDLMTLEEMCQEHAKLFNLWLSFSELLDDAENDKEVKRRLLFKATEAMDQLVTFRALIVQKVMEEHGFTQKESGYYESRNN